MDESCFVFLQRWHREYFRTSVSKLSLQRCVFCVSKAFLKFSYNNILFKNLGGLRRNRGWLNWDTMWSLKHHRKVVFVVELSFLFLKKSLCPLFCAASQAVWTVAGKIVLGNNVGLDFSVLTCRLELLFPFLDIYTDAYLETFSWVSFLPHLKDRTL